MNQATHLDAIEDLAANAAGMRYERLPEEAVRRARAGIMDSLGAMLAGTRSTVAGAIEKVTRAQGGHPQSTAAGWNGMLAAGDAALVNTACGRAFDFDDIHFSIGHHPSLANTSAALAAAELSGASGSDVITAVALGQDFGLRLRRACPLRLGGHSWAAQSYAAMEAALAAGKVFRLDAKGMRNALGIASCFFGGTPQSQHDGATAHLVHHGGGVRAGLMAALYTAEGVTGPHNVLEGEFGLYPAYHKGQFDRALLLEALGEKFLGVEAGFKAYPTCSMIHGAIDAARLLREELNPEAGEIDSVRVEVNRSAYLSCARQPWRAPETSTEAQFSIPYAVALAFVRGHVRLADLTPESLKSCPEVLEVAARVRPVHDANLDGTGSQIAPITVRVAMRDGKTGWRQSGAVKGTIENPMTHEELRAKFRDCSVFARIPLPAARVDRTLGLIDDLHAARDISDLMRSV